MRMNRSGGARLRAYAAADPAYRRLMGAARPITRERERELFQARGTAAWPAAREELIRSQMRLAMKLAVRWFGAVDPDDALGMAFKGLVMAADRHDPTRGTAFTTTAGLYVSKQLGIAFQERAAIHVPHGVFWPVWKGAAAEISEGIRRSAEAALKSWESGPPPESEASERPEAVVDDEDEQSRLAELMAVLPTRHREVLARRLGLGGRKPQSKSRIGAALRVRASRVASLCDEAMAMLKAGFGVDVGPQGGSS